ncbi:MAG: endonuclease/exonuclease/phosphatase family protein [Bacteroidales bacterium]|nr:endonuclease/exonuclease/phosphatase family protein [Bacteroidales bacterium]MDY6347928.1 endonuclease/exonuclease/phosphatase family protein [Bacteroidales bacterium]
MRKLFFILLLTAAATSLTVAQETHSKAIIGFYNVENLFDTIDDPNKNDEQFLPTGDYRWGSQRYAKKLSNLSRVIADMASLDGGLVVLGVSEIENEQVMKDLAATGLLKKYNLSVCHHESPDRRGVDVAFFYDPNRFKILGTRAFPLHVPGNPDFITRDQWLMTGVLDNTDTLDIVVNHWPSKAGGEKRSLPGRTAAGQLARHIADSVLHSRPNAKFIYMGDLNDNPSAPCIAKEMNIQKKEHNLTQHDLFNPMWKLFRDGIGSYAYRDSWEMLDNIIVSGALVNAMPGTYKYTSAHVFRKSYMFTQSGSYMDYPYRTFAGGNYQGGFSDHLPVYIVLTKK